MAILRERKVWSRRGSERPAFDVSRLQPYEERNVRRALRVLLKKAGSRERLAEALGVNAVTLNHAFAPEANRRRISAGLALRAARYAGVPVEELLSGTWPKPGVCPVCGR